MAAPTELPLLPYEGLSAGLDGPHVENSILQPTAGFGAGEGTTSPNSWTGSGDGELGTLNRATESVYYNASDEAQIPYSGELMMQSVFVPARHVFDLGWNAKKWRLRVDVTVNGRSHSIDYTLNAGQTREIVYNFDTVSETVVLDSDTTTPTTPASRYDLLFGESSLADGTALTNVDYEYCLTTSGNGSPWEADNEIVEIFAEFRHRSMIHGELNTHSSVSPSFEDVPSDEWGWEVHFGGAVAMTYDGDTVSADIGPDGQQADATDQKLPNGCIVGRESATLSHLPFFSTKGSRKVGSGPYVFGTMDTSNGTFSSFSYRFEVDERW